MSVTIIKGDGPVILGQPHSGTYVPDAIRTDLNDTGRALLDTDWRVDQLYEGLLESASTVRADFHRYVIDPNRDPSGASLYPGQNTTGLVPLENFDGDSIWRNPPSASDIEARREEFHAPYHAALQGEIDRALNDYGVAILYDCHSIRSELPFLFEDRLPDLNIGDFNGAACAPVITNAVAEVCAQAEQYSYVVNGRFRGGWTTRHYGSPADNVHAIQMELSQRCYLSSEEPPFAYDEQKAQALREVLTEALHALDALARSGALNV